MIIINQNYISPLIPKKVKGDLIEMTKHYIEGLQWVLYYYYRGCPSWNWYYRYHYAPRISDISLGLEELINEKLI